MAERPANVVQVSDVPEQVQMMGERWGGAYKPLTPDMSARGGRLGVNLMRVPPGRAAVPFHSHLREDEVFYVLSGRAVLRYGEEICEIGPGDCISCPAGQGVAHQIANPFDEDVVYLSIGTNDPHEVCVYPDNGKVLVRGIRKIGRLSEAGYMDGEPDVPRIFSLLK